MSELKPCPFCGGEAEAYNCGPWLRDHFMWYVKCSGCSSMTPNKPTEAEAVEAWNTRHVETCTIECNERFANFAYRLYTLSCGHTVWTMGDAPNYCPNCGAKVVDE